MKRLIAITNGDLEYDNINVDISNPQDMILLKSLDGAEVRTNTCPMCKYSPLIIHEGYKICKNCGGVYKNFKENIYMIK